MFERENRKSVSPFGEINMVSQVVLNKTHGWSELSKEEIPNSKQDFRLSHEAFNIAKLTYGLVGETGDVSKKYTRYEIRNPESRKMGVEKMSKREYSDKIAEGARIKLDTIFQKATEKFNVKNYGELESLIVEYRKEFETLPEDEQKKINGMTLDNFAYSDEFSPSVKKTVVDLYYLSSVRDNFKDGLTVGFMWGQQQVGIDNDLSMSIYSENKEKIKNILGIKGLEGIENVLIESVAVTSTVFYALYFLDDELRIDGYLKSGKLDDAIKDIRDARYKYLPNKRLNKEIELAVPYLSRLSGNIKEAEKGLLEITDKFFRNK